MKKFIKYIIAVVSLLAFTQAMAADVYVDIYKTKQFDTSVIQPIVNKYRQQLLRDKKVLIASHFTKDTNYFDPFAKELREAVNKQGKFAYVKIISIEYIQDPNEYVTINVVDAADKDTMPTYLPKPTGHYKDPVNLVRDWSRYTKIVFPLIYSGKIDPNGYHCTKELHCLAPFSTPALKKFEVEFNTNVPKHAKELVAILYNDADPLKRANAAFLLGHTTDKNQLIAWLMPALQDSSDEVRNAAARVLSSMAMKDDKITIPIEPFIQMAHSPVLTDRNKSISVLMSLGKQARYAGIIKKEAGQALMDNLKLFQPDLHKTAYFTLQAISGQHYGERDYAAWSKWLGVA